MEHPLRQSVYGAILGSCADMGRLRDIYEVSGRMQSETGTSLTRVRSLHMGTGSGDIAVDFPRELYYQTISEQSGFPIRSDGDLMSLLTEMRGVKSEYDRVSEALRDVRQFGYGVVAPTREELKLEEPEIVRQGGRYGVRLKASAPSIHMILANNRLWESNIFGKSLYEIAGEGVMTKLRKIPPNAPAKLQQTLTRIVNEGSGSLICIII